MLSEKLGVTKFMIVIYVVPLSQICTCGLSQSSDYCSLIVREQ